MIKGSVAVPIYNSKRIAWLAMESFCRQNKPIDGWELLVFEEKHNTQVGEDFINGYCDRLKEVGCESVKYITASEKVALSLKWMQLAMATTSTSEYFILCGVDDYHQPNMIRDSEQAIKVADWFYMTKGYFYDLNMEKVIEYNHNALTGQNMTARTEYVRWLPMEIKNMGVDGWFSEQLIKIVHDKGKKLKVFIDGSDHWKQNLCTNGLNNISKGRVAYFETVKYPFHTTETKLEEIVPADICERLKELSKEMNENM